MRFKLRVWRQENAEAEGRFETYEATGIESDMSFLEMLDVLNEQLAERGVEPIAVDYDCREGICGSCCLVIDGYAHGSQRATTTCQLYMRHFEDGAEITIEPFRAKAFPIVKDLVVNRSAFDRIIAAGGYVSVNTGSAPDANATPIPKSMAEDAFGAAACIGCGACVAACPNSSAMLFTSAKVAHLRDLPQGEPERYRRVVAMVDAMDDAGFGNCSNHYLCGDACPVEIPVRHIAEMNRDYAVGALTKDPAKASQE